MFNPCRRPTFIATVLLVTNTLAQDVALIPFGANWKYLDNGSNQGTAWRNAAFNDAGWASGPAELGYGDGDEATVVSYGPNASAKHITTYFRTSITLASPNAYSGYRLRIKRDDGFVVYLNGTEVMRQNFDQVTIGHTTLAYQSIANSEEPKMLSQILTPSQFTSGTNVIAVEMHQNAGNSGDLSFDLELMGLDGTPSLFRGPYLQAATPSSIVVRWKTDVPTDTRVRYGTQVGALTSNATNASAVLEHELKITGLQPSTTYYYAIGTTLMDLAGDEAATFFRTAPAPGSAAPVRIWAIGDAGTGYASQTNVRDSYLNYIAGSRKADVWLMLGDNAYTHGRECEYQRTIFQDMYEPILQNTALFPCIGNHDYYSGANGNTNTGTYYTLFAPPTLGEAGGVPSNTEAYYSFDHGNVHFISLDSYGVSRYTTGAMFNWLVSDITQAQANRQWIIAYWHHPPYTKGSHDSDNTSDSGGIMQDMRVNFATTLEAHGVDLVLCGHSHSYERSYLINGHYGLSSTFNAATMKLDGTSGQADLSGPYAKPGTITPHMGTVYTVCGVSGKKDASGSLNHPAMFMSTYAHCGSMVIDVVGSTLSAKFLNEQGAIIDHFDIRKSFGPVLLAPKVLLEGPYVVGTGIMHDSLRVKGLLPNGPPPDGVFGHVGESSSQVMNPSVLTVQSNNAIVDWIWVELRDRITPRIVVASKAALVQRDGDIVDLDGASPVSFNVPNDSYNVAIRHRNHLGVMSALPVALSTNATAIDLTTSSTATYGDSARKNISGTLVMWAGNVVRDGAVKYTGSSNDRDPILLLIGGYIPTHFVQSYYGLQDVNLDGLVKYTGMQNDRDPILLNIGGSTPTSYRTEQLP